MKGYIKFQVTYSNGPDGEIDGIARAYIKVLPQAEPEMSESEKAPESPTPEVEPTPAPGTPAPKIETPSGNDVSSDASASTPAGNNETKEGKPQAGKSTSGKKSTTLVSPRHTEAKAGELAKTGLSIGGITLALSLTGTGASLLAFRRKH
ncbi:Uncharacterised protein [Arcanobacterium haemolyticum]|nr:Uncharacterised protein [Arcanobacterium haemolyticum]